MDVILEKSFFNWGVELVTVKRWTNTCPHFLLFYPILGIDKETLKRPCIPRCDTTVTNITK